MTPGSEQFRRDMDDRTKQLALITRIGLAPHIIAHCWVRCADGRTKLHFKVNTRLADGWPR